MSKPIPICKKMCATCPFRKDSPYADLVPVIMETFFTASRVCHSTGENNAINEHTGKPERLCRGARDVQLRFWHGIRFIAEPTDEAWAAKLAEITSNES